MMDQLQARNLTITYGADPIIEDLHLHIPKGKITVLIGSNGCGKSTILRTLARLLKPNTGSILLAGEEIAHISTKEIARRMSILPQGLLLLKG